MNRPGPQSKVLGIGVRHRLVRGGVFHLGRRASADEAVPDTSGLGRPGQWRTEPLQKVSGTGSDRGGMSVDGDDAIRDPRRCLTPVSLDLGASDFVSGAPT
jgi:hypothetical protein